MHHVALSQSHVDRLQHLLICDRSHRPDPVPVPRRNPASPEHSVLSGSGFGEYPAEDSGSELNLTTAMVSCVKLSIGHGFTPF